jgi:type II secretory pathway pseudopilin PulG
VTAVARRRRNQRRRILIGLVLVILLAVAAWPWYGNMVARARMTKARADTHALARAVNLYRSHTDQLPTALEDLTLPVTNRRGETLTAVFHILPMAPAGFTPYRYERRADGTFAITTAGGGVHLKVP